MLTIGELTEMGAPEPPKLEWPHDLTEPSSCSEANEDSAPVTLTTGECNNADSGTSAPWAADPQAVTEPSACTAANAFCVEAMLVTGLVGVASCDVSPHVTMRHERPSGQRTRAP